MLIAAFLLYLNCVVLPCVVHKKKRRHKSYIDYAWNTLHHITTQTTEYHMHAFVTIDAACRY